MAKKSWVTSTRRTILIENKAEYEAADVGPERSSIMKKIKSAIKEAGGGKTPKKLTHAIDLWYAQLVHGDGATIEDERKWTKLWNLRKVVMQQERAAINELIDAEAGSPEYLLRYPTACTQVIDELPPDQRKEYIALAKAWNEAGPPRDIQIKQSEKFGTIATKFIDEMHKHLGVKVVLYAAWVDKGDDIQTAQLEKNRRSEDSFHSRYPIIHRKNIDTLTRWAQGETRDEVSGDDEEDEDDTIPKHHDISGGKKELWPLEEDKNERAIVPTFEKNVRLGELKDIIRAIFTHAYRRYCNNEIASVPWAELSLDPYTWIRHWNDDLNIKEPSHIRQAEAVAIYQFLIKRQKKKSIALDFKHALAKDMRVKWGKKKRKASKMQNEWVEPDDEEESGRDEPETKRLKTSIDMVEAGPSHGKETMGGMQKGKGRATAGPMDGEVPSTSSLREIQSPNDISNSEVARFTFLSGLSPHKHYNMLLCCLKELPNRDSDHLLSWPQWASWQYSENCLPHSSHSHVDGFDDWKQLLEQHHHLSPLGHRPPPYGVIEQLTLMLGLILRDLELINEYGGTTASMQSGKPMHLTTSSHRGYYGVDMDKTFIWPIVEELTAASVVYRNASADSATRDPVASGSGLKPQEKPLPIAPEKTMKKGLAKKPKSTKPKAPPGAKKPQTRAQGAVAVRTTRSRRV